MSDTTNHGGPAFPVSTSEPSTGHQDGPNTWQFPGMTLRDHLAATVNIDSAATTPNVGKRLVGRDFPGWSDPVGSVEWMAEVRATLRYIEADAMLRARALDPGFPAEYERAVEAIRAPL